MTAAGIDVNIGDAHGLGHGGGAVVRVSHPSTHFGVYEVARGHE